jgi:hypothetical protein
MFTQRGKQLRVRLTPTSIQRVDQRSVSNLAAAAGSSWKKLFRIERGVCAEEDASGMTY